MHEEELDYLNIREARGRSRRVCLCRHRCCHLLPISLLSLPLSPSTSKFKIEPSFVEVVVVTCAFSLRCFVTTRFHSRKLTSREFGFVLLSWTKRPATRRFCRFPQVSRCTPYLAMIFVVLSPCTCHGHVMLLLENPTRSPIDTWLASRCPWGGVTFTIQLAKAGTSRTKRKRQISDPRNHPYQTPATRTSTSTSRRCTWLKIGPTYCGSPTHFDLLLIC